jgi:DNA invertase Pin-like site-specific DNA recombinase
MFQLLGVFAEFEASIIRARVRAGIARVRKTGPRSGRAIGRPRLDPAKERAVRKALQTGAGILKVARQPKVGTGIFH